MARLPPIGEPDDDRVAEIFATFAAENREPILLYRVLAHAPAMLTAYSDMTRALRFGGKVPRAISELGILRLAQLTGSAYEWTHHREMAVATGVTESQLRAIISWSESTLFNERERTALAAMERIHEMALDDATFAALRHEFGDEEAIELIVIGCFYEAVARLIQALGVEVEPKFASYLYDPGCP